MRISLDSSALVKRYIEEPGTARVAGILTSAKEIAVCIICITEVISACNRLVREKKIKKDQYDWIKNEFLLDINEMIILDLTNEVIARSIQCLEKGTVRSLDALHVAAAHEYKCDLFLSGDVRQKKAAVNMGLKVEIV
jgi:predicted nucleic acid-binding protein